MDTNKVDLYIEEIAEDIVRAVKYAVATAVTAFLTYFFAVRFPDMSGKTFLVLTSGVFATLFFLGTLHTISTVSKKIGALKKIYALKRLPASWARSNQLAWLVVLPALVYVLTFGTVGWVTFLLMFAVCGYRFERRVEHSIWQSLLGLFGGKHTPKLFVVSMLIAVLFADGVDRLVAGLMKSQISWIGILLITVSVVWQDFVSKGVIMFNILDVVDDPNKLQAFFHEEEARAISLRIEPEKILPYIKSEVIGQDHVVDTLVQTVARRVQLRRYNKPIGVFMFVGATGSGKTELAKTLANAAFDGRLLRFDMNEFNVPQSSQRLIGSPPGYIGSDRGGQLTQAIRQMGYGVILFDEIEKAHPEVYKTIMALMDEGRITDQSSGEVMDATQFVIILTSNAENRKLAEIANVVTDPQEQRRAVRDVLQTVFKPEQLARMDEIFLFGKLKRRDLAGIVGKFIFKMAYEAKVKVAKVDADLIIELISKHEKVEDYGIRELVRLIENKVIDGMLECRNKGRNVVNVSVQNDEVVVLPA